MLFLIGTVMSHSEIKGLSVFHRHLCNNTLDYKISSNILNDHIVIINNHLFNGLNCFGNLGRYW